MSILRSLRANRAPEQRSLGLTFDTGTLTVPGFGGTSYAASTVAGITVSETTALQQATVWSCVSLVADAMAMLPIDGYVKRGDAAVEVNPKPSILSEPWPEWTWAEWIHRGTVSLLMRGNAYARIVERDGSGFPKVLLPFHPDQVTVYRDSEDYQIYYRVVGSPEPIRRADMLHVRGLAPPGASYLWGLSPIQYAAEAIGVALAAQRFGSALFGEGAQPSSVLTTDQAMNENEAADMKARWDAAHGQGKRGTAVLSGGLQWKPVQLTPEESQFLETRQFSRSEIAGFFRVPPHMIGDVTRSTSWGTGIEEQALGFVTYTLGPWITRWEAALSQVLPKPQYAKFNVAGLLRGRVLDQAQAFRIYRETGMANVDELREKLEWGPLPDGRGQDYLQPLNYAPVLPGGGTVQTPNEPTDAPPSDQTP